jgi:S-methylmethionine-dependent homocysteine/selenocysteine methylase
MRPVRRFLSDDLAEAVLAVKGAREAIGDGAVLPELLAAGVKLVGGCCCTTSAHITALREALDRVS